ncbi:MAG: CHASE2 domain-containing protein [Candidatus Omnitrophica bacterium]|nr:CHASE2 domain-containing protein [Candidatus Omnitrophota bacterium]
MPRFWQDKNFTHPFICWLLFICWYEFFSLGAFNSFILQGKDLFTLLNYSLKKSASSEITIVAIDEDSLSKIDFKWPWKRSLFAELLRRIESSRPKVVGFDFVFSGKSPNKEDDQKFAQVLKDFDNIFLAYYWQAKNKKLLPLEDFRTLAKSIGFVNKPRDFDGVIRKTRIFIRNKENFYFSLEAKIASFFLGIDPRIIKGSGGLRILQRKFFVPASKEGIISLNYSLLPKDLEIIPAYKVLEGNFPSLKDKIVLVGSTASILHDEHPTPLGNLPGIVILANSLDMILEKNYLFSLEAPFYYPLILLLGVLILGINRTYSFLKNSLLTFSVVIFTFIVLLYLRFRNLEFDYFTLFFLLFVSYAISNIYKYSYLIFITNKIKNSAITEPTTGFYTLRYFSLRLGEELKMNNRFFLVGMALADFGRLTKDCRIEEVKSLLKSVSGFLKINLKKKFKRLFFSRLGEDSFLVYVRDKRKDKVKEVFNYLLARIKDTKFEVRDKILSISLKVAIVSNSLKNTSAEGLIYFTKNLLQELKSKKDFFIYREFKEEVVKDKEFILKDTFDFLIYDLEARNKELEESLERVKGAQKETEEAYFEVMLSLIKALEEKDTYTQGHSERVASYAKALAEEAGLSEEECEDIYKAGLLHDIGKIGLPDYILHKKGKLTLEEIELVRKHEIVSVEVLKPIKAFKKLFPIILHHHERFDGTGYPYGLAGNMIPRGAQILAVADSFDAITSGRGYKKGLPVEEALKELERNSGSQFNPLYIEIFKRVIKKKF